MTQTGHAQPERDMRRAGEPYSALMLCRAGRWNVSITLWCRFASDGIRRCSRTPDENSEALPTPHLTQSDHSVGPGSRASMARTRGSGSEPT
jgi:hypothetical protein